MKRTNRGLRLCVMPVKLNGNGLAGISRRVYVPLVTTKSSGSIYDDPPNQADSWRNIATSLVLKRPSREEFKKIVR